MNLVNKRMLLRNKAEFKKSFLCTEKGANLGVWVAVDECRKRGKEEVLKEVNELLDNIL